MISKLPPSPPARSTRVNLGIIGCGAMGQRHIEAASKSSLLNVVAIADPISERVESLATAYAIPTSYADGMELLRDDSVEAVVLALPTATRTPLALEAFRHGKHVLLEKPAAMNLAELDSLISARQNLVGACCSSRYRSLPSAKCIGEFLSRNPLGKIRSICIRELQTAKEKPSKEKPAWRLNRDLNGGGILVNWGCYDLDYILGLLNWNFEPRHVLARHWTIAPKLTAHVPPGSNGETHAIALVQATNGTVLQIERAEYASIRTQSCWEIIGTDGSLRLQLRPGKNKSIHHDFLDKDNGLQSRILWQGDEDGAELTEAPLLDFAQAILEKRDPMTSLENARLTQTITDAIYYSSLNSAPLTLSD